MSEWFLALGHAVVQTVLSRRQCLMKFCRIELFKIRSIYGNMQQCTCMGLWKRTDFHNAFVCWWPLCEHIIIMTFYNLVNL
jgi:hypothetical protein